ncbi:MAG: hypothetical protein A2X46_04685 [Lentisphaerae bacterium GWF2_57_35]|nr:MAG: hypothetical protein A2X46_04685 [Lentisphaerae bacterium GWF2_57_35]
MKERRKRVIVKSRTGLYVVILLVLMPAAILMQSVWISKNERMFKKGLFLQLQIRNVECDHCGGVGLVRNSKKPDAAELCPVCFGVGSHPTRKLDDGDALCPLCGGVGRVIDEKIEFAQTCPRCDGRGLVRLQANRELE